MWPSLILQNHYSFPSLVFHFFFHMVWKHVLLWSPRMSLTAELNHCLQQSYCFLRSLLKLSHQNEDVSNLTLVHEGDTSQTEHVGGISLVHFGSTSLHHKPNIMSTYLYSLHICGLKKFKTPSVLCDCQKNRFKAWYLSVMFQVAQKKSRQENIIFSGG